ncbi:MAG: hypothetical protein PHO46_05115 [Thermoguttaceae bacterium]|nr:hypothetical protein [Thermoguttaceae bacterium]
MILPENGRRASRRAEPFPQLARRGARGRRHGGLRVLGALARVPAEGGGRPDASVGGSRFI